MANAYSRHRLNPESAREGVHGTVRMSGKFTTAGAAAPTVYSTGPWTITYTATGTYLVTFAETFNELLYAVAHLSDATASTKRCFVLSASTTPTAGASPNTPASFSIETQSIAGTAADLTGPVVHFDCAFRKGKLTK